jgi:hemerythrin
MYYAHTTRGIEPQDVRTYARVIREIDEERRELAAFAESHNALRPGFGTELARHRDRLHDLTEQEELMMIRTRYVDFEPHWRAHRKFWGFFRSAASREELLFCSDWLRQHESAADTEFRQWLRHGCMPDAEEDCNGCLYRTDPERILLTVKMQLI